MSNGFNVLKKFVKWQQSVNNGFCTHMWLQNPLFTCYHLTKFFWKKFCQMATKFEQWVLYSHVTTKPIVQTLLPFDKFFCKNKKMSSSIYIRAFQFWTHISILFYYNVNPVIRKWQHRILLTSSFMLEKFPSHSASPRGLESFLAFMTWWVKSYVVISSSQDWYTTSGIFRIF